MTSTRLIGLPDGRSLAVDDHLPGAASAPVVLFLHAAPGSRRLDPSPAATAAAGVRLITVDRPGYGCSSAPRSDTVPSLPSVADDLAFALAELGVGSAAVAGWSSGGWAAAALAARHPSLVRSLALVGTPAPDDEVPWVGETYRAQLRVMRRSPATALSTLAGMLSARAGVPDVAAVSGGPADSPVAADPAVRERLLSMLTEGLREGQVGAAADIVAVHVAPVGFEPASVRAPTSLWYGAGDDLVPPEHGRWWAGAVPGAALHVVPDVGHLVAITAWADVLAALS